MNLWRLERVPEPEEMDDAGEVSSYNSAAAEKHLDAIDETFVEHLLRLLEAPGRPAAESAWALDVGTGPAQIPVKILARLHGLRFVGLDRSANMLAAARQNAARAGVSGRLSLVRSDGHALPFRDDQFSIVISNSVLHHAKEPVGLLREIFRVAAPEAAVLLRDLRRPSRPLLGWHLWRHGRRYHGQMRRLFNTSVKAAYTAEELGKMLSSAEVQGASVFRYRGAHLGIERASQ
jgi:ubiquinone/menaquinone biosynthesis C-methylase UbiE